MEWWQPRRHKPVFNPRSLGPSFTVLVAEALATLPNTWLSGTSPWLGAMALFYWCLYKPAHMPIWTCFFLGLMADGMTYTPWGMHVIGFVALRQVALNQRQFLSGRSFTLVWFSFVVAITMLAVVMVLLLGALGDAFYDRLLFSWLSTCLGFPLVYSLLARLHERLLREIG